MNDKQIQCFIQAATYLNFHRAAEKLYLSQPAMTYQIKSLESELGFPLFDRIGKSLELTRAGKIFYDELIPLTASFAQAIEHARESLEPPTGIIVSWAPALCGRDAMTALVESFSRTYPTIEISVRISERESSLNTIEDNSVIITLDRDASRYDTLTITPLFEATRACLVSQTHPLATSSTLSWDMLKSQTLILTPRDYYPSSYATLIEEAQVHIPLRNTMYLDDVASIDMNIAAGRGVAIRPVAKERLHVPSRGMVAIPFVPEEPFFVSAAFRKDSPFETHTFAKFAHEFFLREKEKTPLQNN